MLAAAGKCRVVLLPGELTEGFLGSGCRPIPLHPLVALVHIFSHSQAPGKLRDVFPACCATGSHLFPCSLSSPKARQPRDKRKGDTQSSPGWVSPAWPCLRTQHWDEMLLRVLGSAHGARHSCSWMQLLGGTFRAFSISFLQVGALISPPGSQPP